MRILNVTQGSPEWLASRARCHTASEAPAMMGASKYQTRSDLLKQKATGLSREVDASTQARFDNGHAVEAQARPLVEAMIGEDLYPVTATDDAGYLLASFDGLTLDESTIFEHKAWNAKLAAQVQAGELEPHYTWQLEQQLLVSGAEKVIFVTSDGTMDKFASMEYRPVPGRAEALLAGWRQFDADLSAWRHEDNAPATAPVGRAPETLPALFIEVTGKVTASNLAAFKASALAVIGDIPTSLTTDEDFANAESAVKWCGEVETRLEAAKQHALSQTASIDELFRTMDAIKAEARAKRLELDKLVKARKEGIRLDILQDAREEFSGYVRILNTRLGNPYLPLIAADFAGAIKGKKLVSAMRDAVSVEMCRAKIEADDHFERIQINLTALREFGANHAFLFSDTAALVQKSHDDLIAVIKTRIAEHDAQEARRLEAERERIRQEEAAKLAREQAAEQSRQRAEAEAKAREEARIEAEKERAEQERRHQDAMAELAEQRRAMEAKEAEARAAIVVHVAPPVPPLDKSAVVLEHSDEISDFLKLKSPPEKLAQTLRAYLVEFVKFQEERRQKTMLRIRARAIG